MFILSLKQVSAVPPTTQNPPVLGAEWLSSASLRFRVPVALRVVKTSVEPRHRRHAASFPVSEMSAALSSYGRSETSVVVLTSTVQLP